MIIDFHTHIFPDKIAKKTIDLLAKKGGIPPFSDGSVDGLMSEMEKGSVDISVALPVLTNPSQFDSVNKFAKEINTAFADKARRIISFAGIHPMCEKIEEKMSYIRENGFLGVKIHPDYQDTFIDDERYIKIIRAAKELDLIVVTHSGVDGAYRDRPTRCTPERVKRVIDAVQHPKLVLAHYGANEMEKETLELLAGENVYFDTAYVLRYISPDVFKAILNKHGADKILFATDSPWSSMKGDVDILSSYSLDKKIEEKILCENARKLLGI
ncbi:MAG: metal-dependent hydrolase [Ruminococcaceae bacterium]|nr:metal-dependent hydrolase [Oscillospiraceae bacterium]